MHIRFILVFLLNICFSQVYSAPNSSDNAVVKEHAWAMAITDSEFQRIPNTAWQYVNLEDIHKIMMLSSENTLLIDDDLGDRNMGLVIQSQIRRGIGDPLILLITREGLLECDYDAGDEACIVGIQFSGRTKEYLPAKVMSKGVVNAIFLYDDDFFEHLETSASLVVEVPVSSDVIEKMIFEVRGFKQSLLEFFVSDDSE